MGLSAYKFISKTITKFTKRLTAVIKSAMSANKFLMLFENPRQPVENQFSDRKLQNIERNQHIVRSVVEAILFCGGQCIALRGDNANVNHKGNPRNFISTLLTIDNHDKILNDYLSGTGISHENIKYTSARTQNKTLDITGFHCAKYRNFT